MASAASGRAGDAGAPGFIFSYAAPELLAAQQARMRGGAVTATAPGGGVRAQELVPASKAPHTESHANADSSAGSATAARTANPAADVWALGVAAFKLLMLRSRFLLLTRRSRAYAPRNDPE